MKEWLKRAVRTFFQAMAGFASANLMLRLPDGAAGGDAKTIAVGFIASAVAAGFAAVMNMERRG